MSSKDDKGGDAGAGRRASRGERADKGGEAEARAKGGEPSEKSERRRSRLEGMVPEIVRRAMVSGIGAIFMTEETIRSTLADMPKDAVNFLVNQADQTKDQLLNLIAREVREFLESADLSEELAKVLSRLTLDVHTQIRFVPTETASGGKTVRPDLAYDVRVKRKSQGKKGDPSE